MKGNIMKYLFRLYSPLRTAAVLGWHSLRSHLYKVLGCLFDKAGKVGSVVTLPAP